MLADHRGAGVPPAESVLFDFIEKMNLHCAEVNAGDFEALHAVGWSDEAIYDAINVCCLFNFYNRWIDASGVHAMNDADHRASGKRMKDRGYLPLTAAKESA